MKEQLIFHYSLKVVSESYPLNWAIKRRQMSSKISVIKNIIFTPGGCSEIIWHYQITSLSIPNIQRDFIFKYIHLSTNESIYLLRYN